MGIYRAQTFPGASSDWERRGYIGNGPVEGLFDSLAGRVAVVVGGGGRIEEILADAAEMTLAYQAVVFAANDIGMYLTHVDHFVSLHGAKLAHWAGIRADKTSKPVYSDFKTHTARATEGIDYHWTGLTPLMVLSGYFAMQLAWIMGAEKIILIGCPGDETKRFFDVQARPGARYHELGVRGQVMKEMARLPDFKSAVSSLSGWTREYFGAPS